MRSPSETDCLSGGIGHQTQREQIGKTKGSLDVEPLADAGGVFVSYAVYDHADRLIFVWLYRLFPSVLEAAVVFKPETLVRWHRSGFRLHRRCKSRRRSAQPEPRWCRTLQDK
jgi:hypothetical protein